MLTDPPPPYLSLGGMLAGTTHQLCGMKPSSLWVIQHAGIPGTRVMDDSLLACVERESPDNSSPHHRTCWASGGNACCRRVFPKRSRSSRPLLVGGGACAGGRQSMLGAWAGGGTEGSTPSDDWGRRRQGKNLSSVPVTTGALMPSPPCR